MRRYLSLLSLFLLLCATVLSSCGTFARTTALKPSSTVAHFPSPTVVPSPTTQPTPTLTPTPTIANPVRLIISSIGVNAPIENVGIASNGDLATPIKSPWDAAGWYNNGPRPGEAGSAVIDGHLDRPGGYPAVFWNLRYMQVGNTVMVVDAQGKTWRFRVIRLASYPPLQAPTQEIFGTTGGNFLNLITCAGTWIPNEHQTTLRLVVYTVLE